MAVKGKRRGSALELRSFTGKDRQSYLVVRTPNGAYHAFLEVEAKERCKAVWCHPRGQHSSNVERSVEAAAVAGRGRIRTRQDGLYIHT